MRIERKLQDMLQASQEARKGETNSVVYLRAGSYFISKASSCCSRMFVNMKQAPRAPARLTTEICYQLIRIGIGLLVGLPGHIQ